MSGQNDEWSYWLDIACGKPLLGSSDRDNGSKDVAELKKLNLRLFIRSNCQRYAVFPGVEFLRILFRLERERKIRRCMFTTSIKRLIRRFSRRSRAVDVKDA